MDAHLHSPPKRTQKAIGLLGTHTIQSLVEKYTGPLSKELWAKARKIKSSYPDRFDYSVYDDLFLKFGDRQPRGGVIFGNPIKLIASEDCKHCFYRFEIDTYGRGCTFNCAFCYAKSYLSIRKWWNEPFPFPIDIADVRKIFATVFESDKKHKYREAMEKRVPLRIGSMSDSFMGMDKKYKVTQELLKILNFYRYPYIIFTRSEIIAESPYIDLMDPKLASVQMSISSIDEKMTKKIEPGAPSPLVRLKALQKVAERGFWTTVRINPLFPIYPDGYYTNPSFVHDARVRPFNYFSWDMVKVIAEHKIPSIIAGMVRLYRPNIHFMNKALGYRIQEHFGEERKFERAALHFSTAETEYYYKTLKQLCSDNNVRFSTCYIGNDPTGASFFRNQHLWNNKRDCCDAVGNVAGFRKTCADLLPPTQIPFNTNLGSPAIQTLI